MTFILIPRGPILDRTSGNRVVIKQAFPKISLTLISSALSLAKDKTLEHLLMIAVVIDNVLFRACCSAITFVVCWSVPSCGLLNYQKLMSYIILDEIWKYK